MAHRKVSDEQVRIIADTVRQYGTLALAAHNAGISPGRLTALLEEDADLAAEINDAMALFKDVIRMQILQRSNSSDAMLKLAAEGFIPEQFKAAPVDLKTKGKPTGLTLRQFNEQGHEVGKEPPPPKPLGLGLETGL